MIFLIVLKILGIPIPCSLLKSVAILQCNSRICNQQPNKLRYRVVSEIGYTIKITILAGKMMIFSQWMKGFVMCNRYRTHIISGWWFQPLRKMSSSVGMIIPNIWHNQIFLVYPHWRITVLVDLREVNLHGSGQFPSWHGRVGPSHRCGILPLPGAANDPGQV